MPAPDCPRCPVPAGSPCRGPCHRAGESAAWDAHIIGRAAFPASPPAPPIDVAARRAAKPRVPLGRPHPKPGAG